MSQNDISTISTTQLDLGALYIHHWIHGFAGVLVVVTGKDGRWIQLTHTPEHSTQLLGHCVQYTAEDWGRVERGQA